jgi:hypothetical protein
MFRLGSLLMMVLLAVPFVRECCLPVMHPPPCHESRHSDESTCYSREQAIAETKTQLPNSSSMDYIVEVADGANSTILTRIHRRSDTGTFDPRLTSDIYLRTGALLI